MKINGPNYTVKDLVYYIGLFGGIIATFFILTPFEVHHIVKLIAGIVVGVGLGWLLETAYTSAQRKKVDPYYDDWDSNQRRDEDLR
jgi:hypothetical protein